MRGPELAKLEFFLQIRLDLLNPDVSRLFMMGASLDSSPLQTGDIGFAVGDGLRANGCAWEVSSSF